MKAIIIGWTIPAILVLAILTSLLFGIHYKSLTATACPRYDAMQYFYKAKNVFSAISNGNASKILEAVPVYRPPGSSLLLYPLGFDTSYFGFYARSVFAPIIIWMGALFTVLHSLGNKQIHRYIVVSICCGACSLPLFYQFETENGISFWGLVDPLFGAVSALAAALLIQGATIKGRVYTMLGWFVASFSLLVKPTGMVIMLACIGIWVVECLIRLREDRSVPLSLLLRFSYEIKSLAMCIFIYMIVLTLCFRSRYLEPESLQLLLGGSKIVLSWMSAIGQFPATFFRMLFTCIGTIYLLPLGIVTLVGFWRLGNDIFHRKISVSSLRTIGIIGLICAAAYWWWTMASPQVRYFYPFLLMAILWILRSVAAWVMERSVGFQQGCIAYAMAPIMVVITLLWIPTPPRIVEKFLGLDLTTSIFSEETKLSKRLLEESASIGRPLRVSISGSAREGALVAKYEYEYHILDRREGSIIGVNLCDWIRDPGIRINELLDVDIFLCDKAWFAFSHNRNLPVRNYHEELSEFFRFLTQTLPTQGIELFQDGALAAYRMSDREVFRKAVTEWARTIKWENGFIERNAEYFDRSN